MFDRLCLLLRDQEFDLQAVRDSVLGLSLELVIACLTKSHHVRREPAVDLLFVASQIEQFRDPHATANGSARQTELNPSSPETSNVPSSALALPSPVLSLDRH